MAVKKINKGVVLLACLIFSSCACRKNTVQEEKLSFMKEITAITDAYINTLTTIAERTYIETEHSKDTKSITEIKEIIYDTSLPKDSLTGKYPISSEIFINKNTQEKERKNEDKEINTNTIIESEENTQKKELSQVDIHKENISIADDKKGFIWWAGMISTIFIISVLLIFIIKYILKKWLKK